MSTAEQMATWREAVGTVGAKEQTAGTTFTTTGLGTFDQPDPFMFGYSFINEPIMTYGAQLDTYDPTASKRGVVSQGYTYGGWIQDDQGLYIGAYIGVRILDIDPGGQVTHHFHFRELAVKNALSTPHVPASYALGAFSNPAPADGTYQIVGSSATGSLLFQSTTVLPYRTTATLTSNRILLDDGGVGPQLIVQGAGLFGAPGIYLGNFPNGGINALDWNGSLAGNANTNGSGQNTYNHNLGQTPGLVLIISRTTSLTPIWIGTGTNSTVFNIEWIDPTTGAVAVGYNPTIGYLALA